MANVGVLYTREEVNQKAGQIAKDLNTVMRHVRDLQAFFAWKPNEDLLAIGMLQAEIDDIKAAFTRLDALRQIYEGAVAQGSTPEDFRDFPKRIWGLGV